MSITKETLIKHYVKAILEGNAGIFAGAGLSRPSGYVDWKSFLRPLAEEIGLDVDKETDLLSIAQYYRNERGTRTAINQEILNAFNKGVKENPNIQIISRLPISTYWTTNYDKLIEKELEKVNRRADVKIDSDQLTTALEDRDAVVYKMHGDVDHPAKAVLTKDDYVLYDKNRPLYKNTLSGDLISKRFLFIGFSFDDPNIDYVLGQIHALLGENTAEHYCIFRKVQKKDYKKKDDYTYQAAKQELKERDLARYGIQTVFVNDWAEVESLLLEIESAVKRYRVFISGSAKDYGTWGEKKAQELSYKLSEMLIKENLRITSGFGFGIGSSIINGALSEMERSKYKHFDEHLCLHPFPQGIADEVERKRIYSKYRKDMINETGIAIFMFGNKEDPMDATKIINSSGCQEEFELSKENKDIIIPLGSTGYAAKEIFDEIKLHMKDYKYLKPYMDVLEKETDINKLVDVVRSIVKAQLICS